MEEQITTTASVEVVDIQFRPGQKVYYFAPAGLTLQPGDHVIIDTARGPEYGICAAGNHKIPKNDVVAPLRNVLRKATAQDEKIAAENQEKEKHAFAVCSEKILEQGLEMQLVSAAKATMIKNSAPMTGPIPPMDWNTFGIATNSSPGPALSRPS